MRVIESYCIVYFTLYFVSVVNGLLTDSASSSRASKDNLEYYRIKVGNSSSTLEIQYYYHSLYLHDPNKLRYYSYQTADSLCRSSAQKELLMDPVDCLQCARNILQQNIIDRSRMTDFGSADMKYEDISTRFLIELYEHYPLLLSSSPPPPPPHHHHSSHPLSEREKDEKTVPVTHGKKHVCILGELSTQLLVALLHTVGPLLHHYHDDDDHQTNHQNKEMWIVHLYFLGESLLHTQSNTLHHYLEIIQKYSKVYSQVKVQLTILTKWEDSDKETMDLLRCQLFHLRYPTPAMFAAFERLYLLDSSSLIRNYSIPVIVEEGSFAQDPTPLFAKPKIYTPPDFSSNGMRGFRYFSFDGIGRGYNGILHNSVVSFEGSNCGAAMMKWFKTMSNRPFEVYFGKIQTLLLPDAIRIDPHSSSNNGDADISTMPAANYNSYLFHRQRRIDSYSSSSLLSQQEVQFFISFDVSFYIETAYGLQQILQQQLGYPHVDVMGSFNHSQYSSYLLKQRLVYEEKGVVSPIIQIVLGPHRPTILTKDYIVFHTENAWDSFLGNPSYRMILENAIGIFAYSQANLNYFLQEMMMNEDVNNVSSTSQERTKKRQPVIAVIPIYSKPVYFEARFETFAGEEPSIIPTENTATKNTSSADAHSHRISSSQSNEEVVSSFESIIYYEKIFPIKHEDMNVTHTNNNDDDEKTSFSRLPPPANQYQRINREYLFTDLLFIGSQSPRRSELLQFIITQSKEDQIQIMISGSMVHFDFFDLHTKEFHLIYSKVVINVHQFNDSILETHRMNHLLSLGKCVISERSPLDPLLDAEYEGAIIFTSYEQIYETALYYIRHDEERKEQEKRALRKYNEIMKDTKAIRVAMKKILIEDPSQMYSLHW